MATPFATDIEAGVDFRAAEVGTVGAPPGTMEELVRLPPPGLEARSSDRVRALELVDQSDANSIRRYRRGFWQRLKFSGEWLAVSDESNLGVTNLESSVTVAVPLGSFDNLLLITPSFEVDQLDRPVELDVPNQLYDASVDFMWRKQFNESWGTMLAITPGYSSDFHSSEDALRIRGRAFATWRVPQRDLTLLMGVVYLDRKDLPLLPGVGLIWAPTPDWRLDLVFPRPKLAYRLEFLPAIHEHWLYVSGQLGGRTWAVTRQDGMSDQLTLRDYRLAFGWERIVEGGGGIFVEVGLSFDRQLEYEIEPLDVSFDRAVLLRGGISY